MRRVSRGRRDTAGEDALRRELAGGARRRASRRAWYRSLAKQPSALLGGAVLLAMALAAVLAPRLAPFHPPEANDPLFFSDRVSGPHRPPFWSGDTTEPTLDDPSYPYDPEYRLGTDWEGRDMLSLLLYGTRYSLGIGLLAVALVALVGAAVGLAAGWLGGVAEDLAMRAADLAEAVPALLAYTLFAAVASEPLAGVLASAGLYLDAVPVAALALSCVGWRAL